jgi:sugar O-acyltransferase (sialic acid O-acetyltransferase NeuD family)
MNSPLIILGAIGNCLDIMDAVLAVNKENGLQTYEILGLLDDEPSRQGIEICGFPVLGSLAIAKEVPHALFVNGIGSPRSYRSKQALIEGLGIDRTRFATIIHPTAVVSSSATIGYGSVVLANCTICSNVHIGDHVMMLPNCVLGHDTHVHNYSTFAASVTVSGSVSIGRSCYLGGSSCIREYTHLGDEVLLGMGAVLIGDAPTGSTMVGNPARLLRN